MTGNKVWNTVARILSAAAVFLLIVSFYHLMNGVIRWGNSLGSTPDSSVDVAPSEVLAPATFICFSLAFYSFSYVSLYYDPLLKTLFVTGTGRFAERAKKTVSSPQFSCELAVVLLLLAVLPDGFLLITGYYRIAAYPVFAVLLFFAWTSVAARLYEEEKRKNVDQKERNRTIGAKDVFRSLGGRVLLFIVLAFLTPTFGAILYTLVKILGLFGIPFIVFLLLLYPLILLIRFLRAVSKRKKILKKLKRICDGKGYSLDCKEPYRSILFSRAEPEITIRTGKETIECKLLCALSKKTPLFLFPDGEASVVHTFRIGKWTPFRYTFNARYEFGEGDRKILLVVPIPRDVYGKGDAGFYSLYSGDRFNGCTVYRASSFLGALEEDDFE